jgi:hypothetical protein
VVKRCIGQLFGTRTQGSEPTELYSPRQMLVYFLVLSRPSDNSE